MFSLICAWHVPLLVHTLVVVGYCSLAYFISRVVLLGPLLVSLLGFTHMCGHQIA